MIRKILCAIGIHSFIYREKDDSPFETRKYNKYRHWYKRCIHCEWNWIKNNII